MTHFKYTVAKATAAIALVIGTFVCCNPNTPIIDEFDKPSWTPIDENKSETMTIIATLPDELLAKSDTSDMLAAFICSNKEEEIASSLSSSASDSECRGVCTLSADGVFYLLVYGNAEDNQQPLYLRYYQTQTKHLYECKSDSLLFVPGARIGSLTPYALDLYSITQ